MRKTSTTTPGGEPRLKEIHPTSQIVLERTWRGQQALMAELIVARAQQRFRSLLNRDAYDMQSYLRVETWTNDGWTTVTTFPIKGLKCERHSYVARDDSWTKDAILDCEMAIAVAMKIVP